MFREMHYMDRSLRATDLAEKMAERRVQSLVVAGKPSRLGRLARMFFPLAATGSSQIEGRA